MIVGIGVDVVSIGRFAAVIARTSGVRRRLFTPRELEDAARRGSPDASLAARFAAKEACRKAIREIVSWQAMEVRSREDRSPSLRVDARPDLRFHLSLSHEAGLAVAMVVAESVAE